MNTRTVLGTVGIGWLLIAAAALVVFGVASRRKAREEARAEPRGYVYRNVNGGAPARWDQEKLEFSPGLVGPTRTFLFRNELTGEEVERFVDRSAGAVCWVVRSPGEGVGVSCVPCLELPRSGRVACGL